MNTIIVYTCNWNPYSGLEKAGFEHLAYPASVYPLKVSCLGRLHPGLVLKAFELGADGVLLLGCPPDECHYEFGNKRAQELFAETAALAHLLGIEPERLGLDWVEAGDGQGFVEKVSRFTEGVNREIKESGNQQIGQSALPNLQSAICNLQSTIVKQAIQNNRAYYCLECGKCTAVCPVSRREATFSPRAIVEAITTDGLNSLSSDNRLWACLTCRRCSEVCPSDVRFSEFTRDLRAWARGNGQEGHCSHGETIQTWMRLMTDANLQQNRLDWLTPDLRTSSTSDTVYFGGCLPYYDVLFQKIGAQGVEIAQSAVQVLNHLGIEPLVLANERCCGHDLLWEGDVSTFRHLAELNTAMLRATGARRLVTTCPECAHTLRVEYRQRGYDLGMEVVHMAELVAQISKSANQQIGKSAIENRKSKITYHDPCRLGRYLKVYDEPRQVIALMGAELVEMENCRARSLCCGSSGWTNCGATAKSIQVDRLREARATGATTLVTACAKCQIHFRCAQADTQLGEELAIEIKDLTTLLAESIAGGMNESASGVECRTTNIHQP
jgi:Fe-S oxidoreductase/coenzyme F420-reducing hydrogenase delta subunit